MDQVEFMMHGAAVVAMTGKRCLAIASDRRYADGPITIAQGEKITAFGSHLYVGMAGFPPDARSVLNTLRFRSNLAELNQSTEMTPRRLTALLTNVLYTNRFQPFRICPIVAALAKDTWEPFVCGLDPIGCQQISDKYVAAGTCKRQLLGCCEIMWEPNMSPDDLFETISQTLTSSCERDLMSGCGATVYVIEKNKVTMRTLRTRMD